MIRSVLQSVLSFISALMLISMASADESSDVVGGASAFTTLLKSHCLKCHGPEIQEGDLQLDTLKRDFTDSQIAAKWIEVMDNLNLGEMPPKGEPQPSPELVAKVTDWIAGELRRAAALAKGTGGRVLMRRLSRTEYANVVRDLLRSNSFRAKGHGTCCRPTERSTVSTRSARRCCSIRH